MSASRPAILPRVLEMPVRRFAHHGAAVRAIEDYETVLFENASRRGANDARVIDQDQPDEMFCLFPARPARPTLIIIGGMGPLAGARAFRQACVRFEDSRAVVLYQACSVPDRSTIILREGRPDTAACQRMAARLAAAVRLAFDVASPSGRPASCIIACNSAHYFWRMVSEDLRQGAAPACTTRMVSLVDASMEALHSQRCARVLILATEGARIGKVFSQPCRDANIVFDEPSSQLSRLLMSAIFEGMKSLDRRRAVALGEEFFAAILRCGRDYDCILAGCTEIPLTIDLLRLAGSSAVSDFLSGVRIVDPVAEALCHV
jgi:aspartate/glutamate racemase